MIYRIYSSDGATRCTVVESVLSSNAAALDWAQSWLQNQSDDERYSIASEDGTFAANFVRTNGGQWFAIGQDRS